MRIFRSGDCPIGCLKEVLSAKMFNPLARAYRAPFDPLVRSQTLSASFAATSSPIFMA